VLVPPWMTDRSVLGELSAWLSRLDVHRATPEGRLEVAISNDPCFLPVLESAAHAVTVLRIERGRSHSSVGCSGMPYGVEFPRLETLVVRDQFETTPCAVIMASARSSLRHLMLYEMDMHLPMKGPGDPGRGGLIDTSADSDSDYDPALNFGRLLSSMRYLRTLELAPSVWVRCQYMQMPSIFDRTARYLPRWPSPTFAPLPRHVEHIRAVVQDGLMIPAPSDMPRDVEYVDLVFHYSDWTEPQQKSKDEQCIISTLFFAIPTLKQVRNISDCQDNVTERLDGVPIQCRESCSSGERRAKARGEVGQYVSRIQWQRIKLDMRNRLDPFAALGVTRSSFAALGGTPFAMWTSDVAPGAEELPEGTPKPFRDASATSSYAKIQRLDILLHNTDNLGVMMDVLHAHPEISTLGFEILLENPRDVEVAICSRLRDWMRQASVLERIVASDENIQMHTRSYDLGGSFEPPPSYAYPRIFDLCMRTNAKRRRDTLNRSAWEVVVAALRRKGSVSSSPIHMLPMHFYSIASGIGEHVGPIASLQLILDVFPAKRV
jgi:hypothetical protein